MPITIITPVYVPSKKILKLQAAKAKSKQRVKQIIAPVQVKRNTNKVLITEFKKKGIIGYSSLKRNELLEIDDLLNTTVVNLKKIAINFEMPKTIKKKIDIINFIIKNKKIKKQTLNVTKDILRLMRKNRQYRKNKTIVLQNEIYDASFLARYFFGSGLIDNDGSFKFFNGKKKFFEQLNYERKNKILTKDSKLKERVIIDTFTEQYHNFVHAYLKYCIDNNLILSGFGSIQYKYLSFLREKGSDEDEEQASIAENKILGAKIRYFKEIINIFDFHNNLKEPYNLKELLLNTSTSAESIRIIGWRIMVLNNASQQTPQALTKLLAFAPSTDRKFHALTSASTTLNKICIYESFLHTTTDYNLLYKRNRQEANNELMNKLKQEGNEIYKLIIEGDLIESLKLLCVKYNVPILIEFYNDEYFIIITQKGKVIDINEKNYKDNEKYLNNFIDQKSLLYDKKGQHIAPNIFKGVKFYIDDKDNKEDNIKEEPIKELTYKLRPQKLKQQNNICCDVYGYDCETYKDEKNNSILYNITLYGKKNINIDKIDHNDIKNEIVKSFYGDYALVNFCAYIHHIADKTSYFKSRPKKAVPKIYIFGFNNSNFDNLLIYNMLHNNNTYTKLIIANSSVKSIKYLNIMILDISLYYSLGNLRKTAGAFKLKEAKATFPYKFVKADNLYYRGSTPELKYWNSKADMDEYIKNEGDIFDMKEYTEKYCILDSKLVYKLGLYHMEHTTGQLPNGRWYNTLRATTAAKTAILMLTQGFQDDDYVQSPNHIVERERLAYKGGRTEKFVNEWNYKDDGVYVQYADINSSYPASMRSEMPFTYLHTLYGNVKYNIDNITDIVPHYLYKIKYEYVGNDKHFIPNLLIREEKTKNIIPVKNCMEESYYHWGCELIEAVLNDCVVYVEEINVYESKVIFKEYVEYFYNARLQEKKNGNVAAVLFFKLLLNSPYGKFAECAHSTHEIVNETSEIHEIINKNNGILKSFNYNDDKIMFEYSKETDSHTIGKLARFSSYIAALSRCNLSKFMRAVKWKNVLYCDTDSVFFLDTKIDLSAFTDNVELGKWKYETSTPIIRCIFILPKIYRYECLDGTSDQKAKGIKAEYLTEEDYNYLLKGGKVEQTNLTFFKDLINNTVNIQPQVRTLTMNNTKRKWYGNESIAFDNIYEWKENLDLIKIENKKLNTINLDRYGCFFNDADFN